jgi:hypothetical protein
MPQTLSSADNTDMALVYDFCNGNGRAAAAKYQS